MTLVIGAFSLYVTSGLLTLAEVVVIDLDAEDDT